MKLAFVLGTRPEGVKLSPLISESRRNKHVSSTLIINTGQHRELLKPILSFFSIFPDVDLNLMSSNQSLSDLTASLMQALSKLYDKYLPDVVVVQGDTTTAMCGALAAFYHKIPVAHIEAGLRTDHIYSPFPEEVNRRIISQVSTWHLAPTIRAKEMIERDSLLVLGGKVYVTGNTGIDALYETVSILKNKGCNDADLESARRWKQGGEDRKIVLVTGHRREHFGKPFEEFCLALRDLAQALPNVMIIYPVHLNPNVQGPVFEILSSIPNVSLIQPKEYPCFVALMIEAAIIITDSGGVQEEAPSLGKPVLVTRTSTERPEAIATGGVKLVGPHRAEIFHESYRLLVEPTEYAKMSVTVNPYGDGEASHRCLAAILGEPIDEFTSNRSSNKF